MVIYLVQIVDLTMHKLLEERQDRALVNKNYSLLFLLFCVYTIPGLSILRSEHIPTNFLSAL